MIMTSEDEDIWLSPSEIADLDLENLPNSKSSIIDWAKKGKWESRPRKGKGGGFIYSFRSLPEKAQQEIKNNPQKWLKICEIAKSRTVRKEYLNLTLQKQLDKDIFYLSSQLSLENLDEFSSKDKKIFIESAHRLIVEEFRLKIDREFLASNLEISIEELGKYEHGEKPLNVAHLNKLKNLGFNVLFILFGEDNRSAENQDNCDGACKKGNQITFHSTIKNNYNSIDD